MIKPDSAERSIPSREELMQEAERKISLINKKSLSGDDASAFKQIDVLQNKKIRLGEELRKKGMKPEGFLCWHMLVGSGMDKEVADSMPLDTPDGDIEKLIDELASQ